jgi:hypothetical protein
MAKSKSASRKSAPQKKSAVKKRPAAKKKATKAARKKRAPVKKPAPSPRAKPAAPPPVMNSALAEIDTRIAIVRNNLRALVEQAASYSGASNEELVAQRIADQEAKLALLMKQREELSSRT